MYHLLATKNNEEEHLIRCKLTKTTTTQSI